MKQNEEVPSGIQIGEDLAESAEFYQTKNGESYISIRENINNQNKKMVCPIDSNTFVQYVRSFAYDNYQKVLTSAECTIIQQHFKMLAWKKGKSITLYHRTIQKSNKVYYDLDGEKTLIITKDGIRKKMLKNPMFIQGITFSSQIMPDLQTKATEIPRYIDKHFHLKTETDTLLLTMFLVTCFWGQAIAHPILQVYGEKGSAKTTCLRRIQDLIDPHSTDIYAMPKKEDDIALCLSSQFMTCFDNISYLPLNVSDLLCRNCTGSSQIKRKLFSDTGQTLINLKSVVCLNGTGQNIVKSDLADRTICIELDRIKQNEIRPDKQLQEEWEIEKPCFLGALFNAVMGVLADTETKPGKSPVRLADFYDVAIKAAVQAGYSQDNAITALQENLERMTEAVSSENLVVMAILSFFEAKQEYTGQITNFYMEVKEHAAVELGIAVQHHFPKSANYFTRYMNENKSNLEQLGIYYKVIRGKQRMIHVENKNYTIPSIPSKRKKA